MSIQKIFMIALSCLSLSVSAQESKSITEKDKAQQKSALVAESYDYLLATKITKGAEIEIDSYDVDSDTYEVIVKKESEVGPNVTTLEYLQKATDGQAMPKGNSKKKSDLVGAEFTIKNDLKLLREKEVLQRAKKK